MCRANPRVIEFDADDDSLHQRKRYAQKSTPKKIVDISQFRHICNPAPRSLLPPIIMDSILNALFASLVPPSTVGLIDGSSRSSSRRLRRVLSEDEVVPAMCTSALRSSSNINNKNSNRRLNTDTSLRPLSSSSYSSLPTSRELCRVLCKVVDDTTYSRSASLKALKQLDLWATTMNVICSKYDDDTSTQVHDAVTFAQDFVELGGVHAVVHFLDDSIFGEDNKCTLCSLGVLHTMLDLTMKGEDPPKLSGKIREAKENIARVLIDKLSGIRVLIRAVVPEPELLTQHPTKEIETSTITDMVPQNSAMVDRDNTSSLNDAAATDSSLVLLAASKAATVQKTMKVLAAIIPLGTAADTTVIIDCVCREVVPYVIKLMGSGRGRHQQAAKLSIVTFLFVAVESSLSEAQPTSLSKKNDAQAAIAATNTLMMQEPNNEGIILTGCAVLLITTPLLTKLERKQSGVITALGTALAADGLSDRVRDVADDTLSKILMLDELVERRSHSHANKASPNNTTMNSVLSEIALSSRLASF